MSKCMNCGGFVTDDYARVFGDNENNVFDCRNCPSDRATSGQSEEGEKVLLRTVRGDDEAYSTGRGSATTATERTTAEPPTAVADGGVETDESTTDSTDAETSRADDTATDATDERATSVRESPDDAVGRFGRLLDKFR